MAEISGVPTADIDNVDGFFTTQGGGGGTATLPTPTIALDSSSVYFENGVTITNFASYTDVVFKVVVSVGGVTIFEDFPQTAAVTWSDTSGAVGARTVSVRAQEFGDFIQSAEVTATYTKSNAQHRYWRLYGSTDGVTASNAWFGIFNFRAYTGGGQTGTAYPPNFTSLTSGNAAGYYIDTVYQYSSYEKWYPFDANLATFHVTLSNPGASSNYSGWYFDPTIHPTVPAFASFNFRIYGNNPASNYMILLGSDTGQFAGEEILVYSLDLRYQTSSPGIYNIG